MDRILPIVARILIAAAVTALTAAADAAPTAVDGSALHLDAASLATEPATGNAADALAEIPLTETAGSVAGDESADAGPSSESAPADSSPLRLGTNVKVRSWRLEQVAEQADRRTRHGFELAGRGAYFAARKEFVAALRLVAEGLDTEQETNVHTHALAAGLTAIKEAEDFLPSGSRVEADVDLPDIVAAHSTPVLQSGTEGLTPMMALRCYLTFAQEQFAAAAGHEVAGAMALHAMGKLHTALAAKKVVTVVAAESKAVVFFQAALLVCPKQFMAANDLGVLLGRCGNYADARTMLQYSLSLSPQAVGWQNLATVYRQLGEPKLAEQASRQAERFASAHWLGDRHRPGLSTRWFSGLIRRVLPGRRRTRRTPPARRRPRSQRRRPRCPPADRRHCRQPRRRRRHSDGCGELPPTDKSPFVHTL